MVIYKAMNFTAWIAATQPIDHSL